MKMDDLIHKIVGTIIEVGQSDTGKFRLGETIRYTPSEILEILKQHENEIFGEEKITSDLISRQAAIDALDQYYKDKKYITRSRSMLSAICLDIKSIMGSLPSAQPEIVRCKECKYAPKCYGDVLMRSRGGGYIYCPVEYCSAAERRPDE